MRVYIILHFGFEDIVHCHIFVLLTIVHTGNKSILVYLINERDGEQGEREKARKCWLPVFVARM